MRHVPGANLHGRQERVLLAKGAPLGGVGAERVLLAGKHAVHAQLARVLQRVGPEGGAHGVGIAAEMRANQRPQVVLPFQEIVLQVLIVVPKPQLEARRRNGRP
jgi:hypothetical protein